MELSIPDKQEKELELEQKQELSYEEEQLQIILMNEMKEQKLREERELKEKQSKEYLEALKIDEVKDDVKTFVEISYEEMIQKRLLRFDK